MKNFTIVLLILMISFLDANAQQDIDFRIDCSPGESQSELNVNNVRATLGQSGFMFNRDGRAAYEVPKSMPGQESGPLGINSAGLWVGVIQNANIKIATTRYDEDEKKSDWYPGPLDERGEISQENCANWDRHFEVLGADIDAFNQLYADRSGNITVNDVSSEILGWPGNGNPFFQLIHGFDLPDNADVLAPYFDRNFDGIYNPVDGDYPIIGLENCHNGIYADQMIFWIYNDNGNAHVASEGDPMRMEVHQLAFAFKTEDAINDMTFQKFTLVNRAPQDMDSVFLGVVVDPRLGCPDDDFIGCSPDHNLAYVYNQDQKDGDQSCICETNESLTTYCDQIPLLGMDFLNVPEKTTTIYGAILPTDSFPMFGEIWRNCIALSDSTQRCDVTRYGEPQASFKYFVESGLTSAQRAPNWPTEYYNYLSGSWRDGTKITYGQNGFNPGSTHFVNSVFSSSPNDLDGWSLCNQSPTLQLLDARWVHSSGPFSIGHAGGSIDIMMGVYFVPNITDYPCPSIDPLLEVDVLAKTLYYNCFDLSTITATLDAEVLNVGLYPNPSTGMFYFKSEDLNITTFKLHVLDIQGRVVMRKAYTKDDPLEIDLGHLSDGTYIIQLLSDKGIWIEKLMKY